MEHATVEMLNDKEPSAGVNEAAKCAQSEVNLMEESKPIPGSRQIKSSDSNSKEDLSENASERDRHPYGDVNMEASIYSDDVLRAGGFGARDDISSFLPIASDSTDFEASLRDARDYEGPQEEASRHGLGWKESTK